MKHITLFPAWPDAGERSRRSIRAFASLATITLALLASLPLRLQAATVDDGTLHREYDEYVSSLKGMKRYHVRYLRLDTEDEAKQTLARIRTGADFATEAAAKSTHKESAAKGGDLGSFAGCRWGKDTVQMLDALKPGQVHSRPVKGTHGWGIYRLESVEAVTPRSFEQYRDEILSEKFVPECPWTPPVSVRR